MKNTFYIFLIGFLLCSCGSSQRTKSLERNNLVKIENGLYERDFEIKREDKTKAVTQIGFENRSTSFSKKRAFFQAYGGWDSVIYLDGDSHPILVWNAVKLIDESEDLFTIYADGIEDYSLTLGSLMVFSRTGEDALENKALREEIVTKTKRLICDSTQNEAFYDVYWLEVKSNAK